MPGAPAMRAGLDIGGTKTHGVVLDARGALAHEVRLPTGQGADAVLETAAQAVRQLATLSGVETGGFASIGIGIPGTVDPETGRVSHAVNLGVAGLELATNLERMLGAGVRVENDVNAAALGAYHLLGMPGGSSMAYLNLGTGLAAGLVLDGRLWRGSRGVAGEIGHIPVDRHGELCPCGQRGCLETAASGSALARQWPTGDANPAHALFAAAASGDPRAIDVTARFADNVAAAVRMLVLTVDPDTVVIGGGLGALGDTLLEAVRVVLRSWADASPFLATLDLPERVDLVPQGIPAAAVGAALVGEAGTPAAQAGASRG